MKPYLIKIVTQVHVLFQNPHEEQSKVWRRMDVYECQPSSHLLQPTSTAYQQGKQRWVFDELIAQVWSQVSYNLMFDQQNKRVGITRTQGNIYI